MTTGSSLRLSLGIVFYAPYLTQWFKRYFSDPEVVFLTIFLLILFAVVLTMGICFAPVLASLVIAYLLEGLVE